MATKQKLTVNLTDEVLDLLREMSEVSGRTVTEELRMAIADRKFFTDQVRQGNKIEVVCPPDASDVTQRHPVRMEV
ncbi:MAG: hypothetical protein FWF43_02575 [Propionibacteriaceae bacterium]|nr:hypothetical protein [Propionibacteriaceae bacterium]